MKKKKTKFIIKVFLLIDERVTIKAKFSIKMFERVTIEMFSNFCIAEKNRLGICFFNMFFFN
jgi:hypothetical protein